MKDPLHLSKRERQIMEIVYRRGEATASEIVAEMADPPSRTAVRTFLRILQDKGHLAHHKLGREFVYRPTRRRQQVARSALRRLLATFFDGSLEDAVAAHLADPTTDMSANDLARLRRLIDEAQQKGR